VNQQLILPSAPLAELANASSPLSPGQLAQLTAAKQLIKPILRAAKLATFNFWSFAISAALSLLIVLFYPTGLLAAACLTLAAYNERRGRSLLRDFDPRGGLLLCYNQLGFLFLVFVYCSWKIADCYFSPALFGEYTQSSFAMSQLFSGRRILGSEGELGAIEDLYKTYVIFFYAAVMALSALIQGLCAWTYYRGHRQSKYLLQQTPKWVLAALKATS
jgi:hypothetical protein